MSNQSILQVAPESPHGKHKWLNLVIKRRKFSCCNITILESEKRNVSLGEQELGHYENI